MSAPDAEPHAVATGTVVRMEHVRIIHDLRENGFQREAPQVGRLMQVGSLGVGRQGPVARIWRYS